MLTDEEVPHLLIFRSDDFICFLSYGCSYEIISDKIISDKNSLQLLIHIPTTVGLSEDLSHQPLISHKGRCSKLQVLLKQ